MGTSASPLMRKLDGQHYDVKVSRHEKEMVRYWIETGAVYAGTYAALGSGMIADTFVRQVGQGVKLFSIKNIVEPRCGSCHHGHKHAPEKPGFMQLVIAGMICVDNPAKRMTSELTFNLTRPEKSIVLLAPLSKDAGGLGICQAKSKKVVFKDKNDADYQKLLASLKEMKAELHRIKRFTMPGFRPNQHYLREMKFYGVLPKDFDDKTPVDFFELDQRYCKSHWYRPANGGK